MTISISQQAYDELFQQENVEGPQRLDPDDASDVISKLPKLLGWGYWRSIELREGLEVEIGDFRFCDRLLGTFSEGEIDQLQYHFHFSGTHQDEQTCISAGQFAFSGTGLAPKVTKDCLDIQPYLEVMIYIKPETLRSFMGDPAGELPPELQPLIKQSDQEQYYRTGIATPAMQTAAQRILQCPYRGISKRLYLEGQALELLGMLMAQEVEICDGTITSHSLKPDVVDRVHHARDILLQRLDNPPSLMELARQVGLNERSLEQGFRDIFSMTVFSYLHDHRLQQASQLLAAGEMKVTEIIRTVGFSSRSYFAQAFRKKFDCNPKDYQLRHKKSL